MTLGILEAATHTSIRPDAPKNDASRTLRTNPLIRLKKMPAPTVKAARERRPFPEGGLVALVTRRERLRSGPIGEELIQELALFLEPPHFSVEALHLALQVGEPLGGQVVIPGRKAAALHATGDSPPHRRIQDDRKDRNEQDEDENHRNHDD